MGATGGAGPLFREVRVAREKINYCPASILYYSKKSLKIPKKS
jgi:hypothetical protein